MTLSNDQELVNTREKLRMLEADYEILRQEAEGDDRVRQLTMTSLKRLINQFTEEIARYEAHQPTQG